MSECTHDCSSCGADCASRTAESLLAHVKTMDQHANGEIRKLTRAINDLIDSSL